MLETEIQAKLMEGLNISEDIAEKLVSEGFSTFDAITYADDQALVSCTGLSVEEVENLKTLSADAALMEAMGELTAEEDNLSALQELGFSDEQIQLLAENKIKTLDDIAELSVDELLDIIKIDSNIASDIIMKARASWFEN